ncbi:hypothetical protein E1265_29875 [Streptomyces sp. 8K308]|uniref:hypothetical protein n=1 Tax=Streptomyces sp. 8K308 TaxID=2530388 RepID=UPI001046F525|nr:hypothetical protein [Streptomyces sp. 8K308]TDC12455.1 hypothetical protein E1265_29875 [Streptomyces sp. 8K308]
MVTGSGTLLVAVIGTWVWVDLETASWVASVVGGVVGIVGLVCGLFGVPSGRSVPTVSNTGSATARDGGSANTGIKIAGDWPQGHVRNSGEAIAEGPGSSANSGIDTT